MASRVSNAVGTQKQFAARPQDSYGMRLNQVNGNVHVDAAENTDGLRLAQSLGVLGTALGNESISREERDKKLTVADFERIAAGMTQEDWLKRDAISTIAERGDYITIENPAAVALFNKQQGKNVAAAFDIDYQLYRKQQPPVKDAEAERLQYQKYMQERVLGIEDIITDRNAFDAGFLDNILVYSAGHAKTRLQELSRDLYTQGVAGFQADIGNLVLNYHTMDNEQFTAALNQSINEARMGGVEIEIIRQSVQNGIAALAERSADRGRLSYLWEHGRIGDEKLGKTLDMSHAVKIAEATQRMRQDKDISDMKEKLLKMSIPEIYKTLEELEHTNNELFQKVIPSRASIIDERRAAEEKAQKAQRKRIVNGVLTENVQQHTNRILQLTIEKKTHDLDGKPVPTSLDQLNTSNPLYYIDEEGNEKKHTVTQGEMNATIKNQLAYIKNNNKLSENEKAEATMELLGFDISKPYVAGMKQQLDFQLGTLTAAGDIEGNDTLQDALRHQRMSPWSFQKIYGEATATEINLINMLSQGGMNTAKGASLYAQRREAWKDPVRREEIKSAVSGAFPKNTQKGFSGTISSDVSINVAAGHNSDAMRRMRVYAEGLTAAGMDAQQAMDISLQQMKDNYIVFNETLIPKGVMQGLQVDNPAALLDETLRDFISLYEKDNPYVDPSHIWLDFDEENRVYLIRGGNQLAAMYAVDYINNYANEKALRWAQESNNGNLDLNQANAERTAGNEMLYQGLPVGMP